MVVATLSSRGLDLGGSRCVEGAWRNTGGGQWKGVSGSIRRTERGG